MPAGSRFGIQALPSLGLRAGHVGATIEEAKCETLLTLGTTVHLLATVVECGVKGNRPL